MLNSIFNFTKAFRLTLFYLLLISILGCLLRAFHIFAVPGNYSYWLHTHSHIALLGWAYNGIILLVSFLFFKTKTSSKYFKLNFIFTQLCLLAMFLSFPFQGYAFYSIIASSLFLISTYIFTYQTFKYTSDKVKKSISFQFLKWALFYLILSSFGTWSLGFIISQFGSTSNLYKLAIYFYLHFQYNGWLILALTAIFFKLIEQESYYSPKLAKQILYSSNLSIILSYSLSTLWTNPPFYVYIIGFTSVFFMILSFYDFHKIVFKIASKKPFNSVIFKFIYFFLGLRIVLLSSSSIPKIGNILDQNRSLVIAYLHLIFLGIISLSILGFINYLNLIKLSKKGVLFLIIGVFSTEILLFYKGFCFYFQKPVIDIYYPILLGFSFMISISSLLFFINSWSKKSLY